MSYSLIHLGFLMAQGDPKNKKAQKQMLKLSRALQKIDLEKRMIENTRYFHDTCLSEAQKLKVYEGLLKTHVQIQKGDALVRLHADDCPQERTQNWRQRAELQRGAWTGFALLLGAIVANTACCEAWLSQYGAKLGVFLQLQSEYRQKKNEPWIQSPEQIAQELSAILFQMRHDLKASPLAFQYLRQFGLEWSHSAESSAAH